MVGLPIRTGEWAGLDLTSIPLLPGVILSLPVRITCLGVWLTCALLRATYARTPSVTVINSVWEAPPTIAILSSILGSVVGTMIGRVQLLNNFYIKILFLVYVTLASLSLLWVTFFGLLAGSPFASFAVADFDTYYSAWLIVKSFNVYTRSPNLSSFSIVKIAFELSLCVLDVWLKVSDSVLDSYEEQEFWID